MKKSHNLLLLLLLPLMAHAQHGLDQGFGNNGIVITPAGTNNNEWGNISLLPGGNIIALGTAHGHLLVAKYKPDGSLDPAFGSNGQFGYGIQGCQSVILPDSGMLIGGSSSTWATQSDFCVLKVKANGTVDSSFGVNGIVSTDMGGQDYASGIALQDDGKIIVSGTTTDSFAMVRYMPDGVIDTSFGNNGKVGTYGGMYMTTCNAIVLQNDGKILLTGNGYQNGNPQFLTLRYNADGSPDISFNHTGRVEWQPGEAVACDIKLQPDGKILIAGGAGNVQMPHGAYVVMRLNTDGTPDTSFNHVGHVFVEQSGYTPNVYAFHCRMALLPDGRIVLGGVVSDTLQFSDIKYCSLARVTAAGSVDNTFGTGGKQVLTLGMTGSGINGVALQGDGKIIAAGFCNYGNNKQEQLTLARFMPDGNVSVDGPGSKKTPVINIYPVPANQVLHITNSTDEPVLKLSIIGMDGKECKIIDRPGTTIQVSDLAPGNYFARFFIPGYAPVTRKLLITHTF